MQEVPSIPVENDNKTTNLCHTLLLTEYHGILGIAMRQNPILTLKIVT